MKVLMLSTDEQIFEAGSEVGVRLGSFGAAVDHLDIIVVTRKSDLPTSIELSPNVTVHLAGFHLKLLALWRAYHLGKKLSQPDIVTAQDPFEVGLIGYLLSRHFGSKLELQLHTDPFSPQFVRASFLNYIRLWIAKRLWPKADQVRVVSKYLKINLVERGLAPVNKITILPVWVDVERIHSVSIQADLHQKYPQFGRIILMASRLTKEKNFPLALQTMALAIKPNPKLGLVIVGFGPEREKIKRQIVQLRLQTNVVLEDWTADLPSYYKTADLFLLTSFYEGYGRTLIEAAAVDLPIISTDVGVAREVGAIIGGLEPTSLARFLTQESWSRSHLPENFPTNKENYLQLLKTAWQNLSSYSLQKINLLILTQKVDQADSILGFFHRWLEEFAKHCSQVLVICLEEGQHQLPPNVRVLSLGKKDGISRLKYLWRFYCYIWSECRHYDAVFVHMNQEYVLLGWKIWKLLGKKIYLWRNHAKGNWLTYLAVLFSNKVFCTSRSSYTAKFKKTIIMPVGVNTEIFKRDESVVRKQDKVLFFGRLSPVKRAEVFLAACATLKKQGINFRADLVGDPLPVDRSYYEQLKKMVDKKGLGGSVTFKPAIPNSAAPALFNNYAIYINLTPAGSFDKTIVEAMACECVVLVCPKDEAEVVAQKASELLSRPEEEKRRIGQNLRREVVEKHSLKLLGKKLFSELQ